MKQKMPPNLRVLRDREPTVIQGEWFLRPPTMAERARRQRHRRILGGLVLASLTALLGVAVYALLCGLVGTP